MAYDDFPRRLPTLGDGIVAMQEEAAKHRQNYMVVKVKDQYEVWSFDYWLDMCKAAQSPIKYLAFHRWSRYDK